MIIRSARGDKMHLMMTNGMVWMQVHPQAVLDHLGCIPGFLNASYGLPAVEQIAETYGWHSYKGLTLPEDADRQDLASLKLLSPDDPPLLPLWAAGINGELVVVYEYGWTAVFQSDLSFDTSRLD